MKVAAVFILITLALALAGCRGDMSRGETIQAVKQCRDGGLSPIILINGWTGEVRDVICQLPAEHQL